MNPLICLFFAALLTMLTIDVGAQPAGDVEKLKRHFWRPEYIDPYRNYILCELEAIEAALGDLSPDVTFSDVFAKLLTEAQKNTLEKFYYVAGFSQWMAHPTRDTTFWPYFRVFSFVLTACGVFLREEGPEPNEEAVENAINDMLLKRFHVKNKFTISERIAPWATKLIENIKNNDNGDNAEDVAKEIVKVMFEYSDVQEEIGQIFEGSAPIPKPDDAFNYVTDTLRKKDIA